MIESEYEEIKTDTPEGRNRVILMAKLGVPLEFKDKYKWRPSELLKPGKGVAIDTVYRIKK